MNIISTIGTSIITNIINGIRNSQKDEEKEALKAFEILARKDYKDKEKYINEYNYLKNFIKDRAGFDPKTSAEIKSIIYLKQRYENIKFIPICTDTILSPLGAEIINDLFLENNIDVESPKIIEDLQVSDYKRFKNGLKNLINTLDKFSYEGKFYDTILNITGGFKGVIPYMTIYGQVNKIPIFYIFEFTNELIEIPQLPIDIDYNVFEKDWKKFYLLDSENTLQKDRLGREFLKQYENLLEIIDDMVSFNPLGQILWNRYKKDNFIFFTTDEIEKKIKNLKNVEDILKRKFIENFDAKTEEKNGHKVYDDGNNQNRIFYFKDDNHFYIYEVFENHDRYERYLNSNRFDKKSKEEFKKSAKLCKI